MSKEYYTSVSCKFGKILYRGYKVENDKRIRVQGRLAYKPSVYLECDEDTEYKSLYGKSLRQKKFSSITEMREFVKTYKDVMSIYGYAPNRIEYNFIAEAHPDKIEVGIDSITVGSIDIETTTEHGKMDVVNCPEEIILITYQNLKSKELITWGCKKSTAENYVLCKDEADLLKRFVGHVKSDDPDVITGWNCQGFDIPYIINRGTYIIGKDAIEELSPFGIIEMKEENIKGRDVQVFTIVGRTVLDLLELYLKFTFIKRINNKLDTIAKVELGAGKLENPYETFREFYTGECTVLTEPDESADILKKMAYKRSMMKDNDQLLSEYELLDKQIKSDSWNRFVSYNQVDVLRVSQLEDKLGLISLAMSIAYLAKINYSDVYGPVKTWECMILSKLYNDNKFASIERKQSTSNGIVGAYVHTPKPGFYDWIVSIDATALYPSIAIGLNMSPETIIGMDSNCSEASLLENTYQHIIENCSIAANGAIFSHDKQGIIPSIMQELQDARTVAKKEMLQAKQKYIDTGDIQYKKIVDIKGTSQLALKILNNSGYGGISNTGFLFFDNRIAEGITMSGRYIIQYVSRHFNTRLNEFFKTDNVNYIAYMDTDSSMFSLGNIVEKYYKGKSDAEITTALDNLMEKHLRTFINEATDNIAKAQNYYKKTIYFKREKICSSGFWLAPKKYALKVYDNEGVRYAEPDYAITGIEVVRSSTPEISRNALRQCVIHIINKDIDALRNDVDVARKEFMFASIEDIAKPSGVNNMLEYTCSSNIYKKGCPMHVRGALLHNHYVTQYQLEDKYQPILEGDKILLVYLKVPNTIKENVISFTGSLPKEFGLEKYVDRELQFQKVFMAPLEGILTAVSWTLEEKDSLDAFFS